MSALVSTVMMATLVVGPFYLSRALGLDGRHWSGSSCRPARIGRGADRRPAGRIVDRFGARRMTVVGLVGMAAGCVSLALMPASRRCRLRRLHRVMTAGYALFQAANNTAIMTDVRPDQRGVISGMLSLSRNLGLITGASVMGAVFAFASAATDIATAHPKPLPGVCGSHLPSRRF